MNCSVPECSRTVVARGWCKLHWQRWYRTGSVTDPGPRVISAETRRKINRANKGRAPVKMADWTGRTHTAESKAKMSAAKKGRSLSEKHKRKLGEALKGRKQNPEAIHKRAATRKIPANRWVAYQTVHHRHMKVLPVECLHCGARPVTRGFACALQRNVPSDLLLNDDRGRIYSSNEDHYIRLCPACHSRYDRTTTKGE